MTYGHSYLYSLQSPLVKHRLVKFSPFLKLLKITSHLVSVIGQSTSPFYVLFIVREYDIPGNIQRRIDDIQDHLLLGLISWGPLRRISFYCCNPLGAFYLLGDGRG